MRETGILGLCSKGRRGEEKERVQMKPDPFEMLFTDYVSADLVSSGMTLEQVKTVLDSSVGMDERWNIFEQLWER